MTLQRPARAAVACMAAAALFCDPQDETGRVTPALSPPGWHVAGRVHGDSTFFEGDTVSLSAWLVDSLGDSLDAIPDSVRWHSDLAGDLGAGQVFSTPVLASGVHRITAVAWLHGVADSATVRLRVIPYDSIDICVTGVAADGSIVCWRNGVIFRYVETVAPLRVVAGTDAFYLWEECPTTESPKEVRYWRDTTKVVLASKGGRIHSLCVERSGVVCALVLLDSHLSIPGRYSRFVVFRGNDTLLPPDTPFVPSCIECRAESVGVWGRVSSPAVFEGFRCWGGGVIRDSVALPASTYPHAVRTVRRDALGLALMCDVETVVGDMMLIHGWYWNNGTGQPIRPVADATSPLGWIRLLDCCFAGGHAHAVGMVVGYPTYYYYWENGEGTLLYVSNQSGPAFGPTALTALHGHVFIGGACRDSSGAVGPCYQRNGITHNLAADRYTDVRVYTIAVKDR